MKKRIATRLRTLAARLDPPPPASAFYVDHRTFSTGSVASGVRIITNR